MRCPADQHKLALFQLARKPDASGRLRRRNSGPLLLRQCPLSDFASFRPCIEERPIPMADPFRVYIGWDQREPVAYDVAKFSLERRASIPVAVTPIKLD